MYVGQNEINKQKTKTKMTLWKKENKSKKGDKTKEKQGAGNKPTIKADVGCKLASSWFHLKEGNSDIHSNND